MKDKESKRFSFAHICAYLSLVISVTMIVLWCCNAGGFKVVSLDSFVGVIVALLAIVVTLVLGWQIYNALELKAKIEELNIVKEDLNRQEKESKEENKRMNHLITVSLANIEINNKNYGLVFLYSIASLESAMSLDTPINIESVLARMELSVSQLKQGFILRSDDMKNIYFYDKNIRTKKLYDMIKTQYENIYNDFISKVKYDKDE